MNKLPLILMIFLIGCSHPESNSQKLGEQIQKWVPFGTSLEEAQKTMEQHQFTCSVVSYENAAQMSNSPDAVAWKTTVVRNNQSFKVTNVSHLVCEKLRCSFTFSVVNGQISSFWGGGSL